MANSFLKPMWQAVEGPDAFLDGVAFRNAGALSSILRVTDFASAAIATAGLAVAELANVIASINEPIQVDRRLASFWFLWSLRPLGWSMPAPWDPIAGDYEARDGWIRLHTNAPHHRAAAQRVLGAHDDKPALPQAVKAWDKRSLETAIVEAGGCAAEMRSIAEWAEHEQGRAAAAERLVQWRVDPDKALRAWSPDPARPLAGLRVLDLTRVLAGPVATRFLAGYGADVLRIDPPDWDEPGVVPEVALGKHCTRLDLTSPVDRDIFETLLSGADVLVHGYRDGALDALGYDIAKRRALSPGLIDVSLDAYGWSGPWRGRRGFDSLVQMSSGIADAGMAWKQADRPAPLPAQALDHATGYLMAAAVIRAITRHLATGQGTQARLSLARTAGLLVSGGEQDSTEALARETDDDHAAWIEKTSWGEARRLKPPLCIEGVPMRWDRPATALGSARPAWS